MSAGAGEAALQAHLAGGQTTLCHAWAVTRTDGTVYGFTDHDLPLMFEGVTFRAESGLAARSLQQSTGLSVDNTEALGVLQSSAISDADIEAGRFDGAEVRCWRVNWAAPAERALLFRGTIGEMRRAGAAFTAELRGLTEALNRPLGRVYQKPCTAVLGDAACGVDLSSPDYALTLPLSASEEGRILRLAGGAGYAPGWFRRGRLVVVDGAAAGLSAAIKRDSIEGGTRLIELWEPLRATLAPGDHVTAVAGCDKRFGTCRAKFGNLVNFQGFPDLPGDGWLLTEPGQSGRLSGGSRR